MCMIIMLWCFLGVVTVLRYRAVRRRAQTESNRVESVSGGLLAVASTMDDGCNSKRFLLLLLAASLAICSSI